MYEWLFAPPGSMPPDSTQLDYEAELEVVIGRRATRVARAAALEHVLGYVNFNDVSARPDKTNAQGAGFSCQQRRDKIRTVEIGRKGSAMQQF